MTQLDRIENKIDDLTETTGKHGERLAVVETKLSFGRLVVGHIVTLIVALLGYVGIHFGIK